MQSYIIKTLILTFIILVVIYIFIFREIKNRKSKTFDSIQDYHDKYLDRSSITEYKSKLSSGSRTVSTRMSADSGSVGRSNYITKYNSDEDYREL